MAPDSGPAENLPPIFVSVKQAAQMLGISPWSTYQLLDEDPPAIESRYHGRRRLVVLDSLRDYAAAMPSERPTKTEEPA